MDVSTLHRRRPLPVLTTVAFLVACGVTVAYFAGIVPGVPKTLPVFTDLLTVTLVLFVSAVTVWLISLFTE
ncbi:hypothetical protein ACFQMF_13845 [Halorubrum rutilum]|uniref:Uncharacterized protein n=1 Tax=Halorubrum rutilum TaxID=1364933 RepID=A0ABD6AMX7_9EURY|nr:hypothetical protein [Halorubrum rutilum]